MNNPQFCPIGTSPIAKALQEEFYNRGLSVQEFPDQQTTHLILPIPSWEAPGILRGGIEIQPILDKLSSSVRIYGGMLHNPLLENYRTVDLLADPIFLAKNAAITAECALGIAIQATAQTVYGANILIIGWGRIAKHLAHKFHALGATISIAARKEQDRAMAASYGYYTYLPSKAPLQHFDLIINTAPESVYCHKDLQVCKPQCVKMDLASIPGLEGPDILWERGLPGKYAPVSTAKLILETIITTHNIEEESE